MTLIAFIGLGHMGGPMAINLARAGFAVRGYDLVPAAREAAQAGGVDIAVTAFEAAVDADVVVTMLPTGRHVADAYSGQDGKGLVDAAREGALFIDCSTIAVHEAQHVAEMAKARGHRALDAPVSGGVIGAENATLAFMVGGDVAEFDAARPVLEAMGKRIVHCGDSGLGQAAKLCNNMILAISQIAVAEAFVLGENLGLSHQALYDVASNATGQCWALTTNCPVPAMVPTSPANRDYRPGFAGALMAKDLGLAEQAISRTGVDAQLGRHAHALYTAFAEGDGAHQDFSAIITTIRSHSSNGRPLLESEAAQETEIRSIR